MANLRIAERSPLQFPELPATAGYEHLRALLESAAEGIYGVDMNGRCSFINPSACGSLGYTQEELLGQNMHDLIHKKHEEGSSYAGEDCPLLSGKFTSEPIRLADEMLWRRDGSCFPVELSRAPILNKGRLLGSVITFTDITERKRSEDAMRKTDKLAAVGRLAASIAHEINNPLEAVTNLLYLLQHSELNRTQSEWVLMAQKELARVAEITKQTLRFHRQSTRPTQAFAPDIIESVLTLHQGKLMAAHIKVERDYTDALPILCYEGEIRQVMANLIGNAIDALSSVENPVMKIRVRQFQEPRGRRKGISISVADNGRGIKREVLARVFEPFYTTKGITGTGLGLWVSKELVGKHGGMLRVRSSSAPERHGTVFNVWLPADPRFKN